MPAFPRRPLKLDVRRWPFVSRYGNLINILHNADTAIYNNTLRGHQVNYLSLEVAVKRLIALIVAFLFSTSAIACDQVAAGRVQTMLHDMATWYEKDGKITFKWGSDWDHAAPHERLGLIRSFADSVACLTGRTREINFYRKGKLVGKASQASGIQLVD